MPWWAWLLVDVVIVLAAIAAVARAYWRGWKTVRAFFRDMAAIMATVPTARDLRR